jgi:hypothetical protein
MDTRFIVTLAWILKKPLTLLFDPYESIAMFLSGKCRSFVPAWMTHKFCTCSAYRKLRCTRWQIKLVRGIYPDGSVLVSDVLAIN